MNIYNANTCRLLNVNDTMNIEQISHWTISGTRALDARHERKIKHNHCNIHIVKVNACVSKL